MRFDKSPNLDFLRTVAVSLVVSRHLIGFYGDRKFGFFDPQAMGILGVLLFFVHTSLVLMYSLQRQEEKSGSRNLFSVFLLRRCFRIYPLSVFVVMAVFLFIQPLGQHGPGLARMDILPHISPAGLISNLLLIQNLTKAHSIIGPLWSLPLEMQMYLFLPALYLYANRVGARILVFGVWPLSVAAALVSYKLMFLPDLLRYVPCFVPGVICYRLSLSQGGRKLPFRAMPITLALCFLFYMVAFAKVHAQAAAGYPVCLALGLMLPRFTEMESAWGRKLCSTAARYSYGIYLVHVPCIWFAFVYLRLPSPILQWGLFIVSLSAVSALLYHTIEAPMIRLGSRIAGRIYPARPAVVQEELVQVGK